MLLVVKWEYMHRSLVVIFGPTNYINWCRIDACVVPSLHLKSVIDYQMNHQGHISLKYWLKTPFSREDALENRHFKCQPFRLGLNMLKRSRPGLVTKYQSSNSICIINGYYQTEVPVPNGNLCLPQVRPHTSRLHHWHWNCCLPNNLKSQTEKWYYLYMSQCIYTLSWLIKIENPVFVILSNMSVNYVVVCHLIEYQTSIYYGIIRLPDHPYAFCIDI